jgi:alpha-N-arabinofuranosidase
MRRRTVLKAAVLGAAGALRRGFGADVELELSPADAGAEISPHIYGHFIEHLGGVI